MSPVVWFWKPDWGDTGRKDVPDELTRVQKSWDQVVSCTPVEWHQLCHDVCSVCVMYSVSGRER